MDAPFKNYLMEYLGLLFELIFLSMGVYLYLVSIGKIVPKDPQAKARSEAFREKNGRWLRPVSLALVALMVVNVFLHIKELFF